MAKALAVQPYEHNLGPGRPRRPCFAGRTRREGSRQAPSCFRWTGTCSRLKKTFNQRHVNISTTTTFCKKSGVVAQIGTINFNSFLWTIKCFKGGKRHITFEKVILILGLVCFWYEGIFLMFFSILHNISA